MAVWSQKGSHTGLMLLLFAAVAVWLLKLDMEMAGLDISHRRRCSGSAAGAPGMSCAWVGKSRNEAERRLGQGRSYGPGSRAEDDTRSIGGGFRDSRGSNSSEPRSKTDTAGKRDSYTDGVRSAATVTSVAVLEQLATQRESASEGEAAANKSTELSGIHGGYAKARGTGQPRSSTREGASKAATHATPNLGNGKLKEAGLGFPQVLPCCTMHGVPAEEAAGGAPQEAWCKSKQHAAPRCSCTVLHRGPRCQWPIALVSREMTLSAMPWDANLALNRRHLDGLNALIIDTPLRTLEVLPTITPAIRANLSQALPRTDPLKSAFFRSCALVGGSASLLHRERGAEIDANEMVVRFNKAPTQGYEAFVGRKTTLRISNGEHLGWREGSEPVIHHLRSRSFLVRFLVFAALFPGRVPMLFDPDFTQEVGQLMGASIPSSGLAGVVLAMQICGNITAFGFGAPGKYGVRNHYYNTEAPANSDRDDGVLHILLALEDRGLLHIAEDCARPCHTDSYSACMACYGGEAAFQELLMRERWTEQQRRMQQRREQAWALFSRWEQSLQQKWSMTNAHGLQPLGD